MGSDMSDQRILRIFAAAIALSVGIHTSQGAHADDAASCDRAESCDNPASSPIRFSVEQRPWICGAQVASASANSSAATIARIVANRQNICLKQNSLVSMSYSPVRAE